MRGGLGSEELSLCTRRSTNSRSWQLFVEGGSVIQNWVLHSINVAKGSNLLESLLATVGVMGWIESAWLSQYRILLTLGVIKILLRVSCPGEVQGWKATGRNPSELA